MRPKVAQASLLAALLLVLAEVVVRTAFASNMAGRFEYGFDATSGFETRDDGTVELVREGGRRFRPQQFALRRPEGVFRAFVVGDSVPRGPSLEEAYPARLAASLGSDGVPVEALNLGVAGYGARRLQIILKRVLAFEPSVVVLHVNDSNEFEDERDLARAQAFRSAHPRNWPMKSFVFRRLYEAKSERLYWNWVPAEVRNRGAVNDAGDETTASRDLERRRRWLALVRDKLAEDVALVRAAGVPLLVVTQARAVPGPDGRLEVDDRGLDGVAAEFAGDGVATVSMKETFRGTDLERLFSDGAHLRAPGHEILAGVLRKKIEDAGWIRRR
jgi:hypothetical protein